MELTVQENIILEGSTGSFSSSERDRQTDRRMDERGRDRKRGSSLMISSFWGHKGERRQSHLLRQREGPVVSLRGVV